MRKDEVFFLLPDGRRAINQTQAALFLERTTRTLQLLIERGEGPECFKVGRDMLFPVEELARFKAARDRATTDLDMLAGDASATLRGTIARRMLERDELRAATAAEGDRLPELRLAYDVLIAELGAAAAELGRLVDARAAGGDGDPSGAAVLRIMLAAAAAEAVFLGAVARARSQLPVAAHAEANGVRPATTRSQAEGG